MAETITLQEWVKALSLSECHHEVDGYTSSELADALQYRLGYFRSRVLPDLIKNGKVRIAGKKKIVRKDGTQHWVNCYALLKTQKKTEALGLRAVGSSGRR